MLSSYQVSINSSKVYCKFSSVSLNVLIISVLIVAKCIVNLHSTLSKNSKLIVLIVAKCIVNLHSTLSKNSKLIVLIVAKCIVNKFYIKFFEKYREY